MKRQTKNARTFRRILFTRRVPLGVGTTESLGHGSSLGWLLNQQIMVTSDNWSVVVVLLGHLRNQAMDDGVARKLWEISKLLTGLCGLDSR